MSKKLLASLVVAGMCVTAVAGAAPITDFHAGEGQLDLGAWDMKIKGEDSNIDFGTKWNFMGGLTYGLGEKIGLGYEYHGLKSKDIEAYGENYGSVSGREHEVNLYYTLAPKVAVFAGWNHIAVEDAKNNVAQLGFVGKAPLGTDKFNIYGKVAGGTKSTWLGEAGLAYTFAKDLDLNVGYRYLQTKFDGDKAKFKGLILGLSYRFGGHKAAPVEEPMAEAPVAEPAAPAPVATVPANDYYFNSIHFDFDKDNLKGDQVPNADSVVNAAKQTGHVFKLVGNTDGIGTSAYNEDLSKRRVDTVAEYVKAHGVPANQIVTIYRGKTDPAATNATDAGRATNRRVDVWEHK